MTGKIISVNQKKRPEIHTACLPSHRVTIELEGTNHHRFFPPNPHLQTEEMTFQTQTHTTGFWFWIPTQHSAQPAMNAGEAPQLPSTSPLTRVKGYLLSHPVLFTLLSDLQDLQTHPQEDSKPRYTPSEPLGCC